MTHHQVYLYSMDLLGKDPNSLPKLLCKDDTSVDDTFIAWLLPIVCASELMKLNLLIRKKEQNDCHGCLTKSFFSGYFRIP